MAASKPMFQRFLFLFKVTQEKNNDWDTYDSFVVAARTSSDAKFFHPAGDKIEWDKEKEAWAWADNGTEWDAPDWVSPWDLLGENQVECIGRARLGVDAGDVICSSFNAG